MHYLIIFIFSYICIGEFLLEKIGIEYRLLTIVPEVISLIVGIYILLYFALKKTTKIQWRYIIFFIAFVVHIAIGIIGNQVQPLAIFAGLRAYLKFLPFYLLPMVYEQDDEQIKSILKVLLTIAIIQIPISLYQRLLEFSRFGTGDYVSGTLTASPILTLFLVCSISVLVGFYLTKKLSLKNFCILIFAMFIPTTINETKSTVILTPLALLVPVFFHSEKKARMKMLATVLPTGLILLVGFHYTYKSMYAYEGRSDIIGFFSSGKVEKYLYQGTSSQEITGENPEMEVRRIDAIILAYKEASKDFFKLCWGVGIGNAALSFSRKFQGNFNREYMLYGGKQNSISHFIWEIGILGIFHIIWFLVLIFLDAISLRNTNDIYGTVAAGWIGVVSIFLISLPYQNIITKNELMYPFIFISALLAAKVYVRKREIKQLPHSGSQFEI